MSTALVTGGTGFLGSSLVRVLNERGYDVVLLRRASSKTGNLAGCKYREIIGDAADKIALARAVEGCDCVFHLAACTSLLDRDKEERRRVNVGSVLALKEILLSFGKKPRWIQCSSVAAVGLTDAPVVMDEKSPFNAGRIDYSASKKLGEEIVLEGVRAGLDAVIVNPATLIGPRAMRELQKEVFLSASSGRALFYPPGGACFASVDDAARGMVLAAEKGRSGQRYILGGENMTIREYLSRIAGLSRARPPAIGLPGFLLPPAGRLMELIFGKMGKDTGRFAAGFGYFSSDKAVRELGYSAAPIDRILSDIHRELVLKN